MTDKFPKTVDPNEAQALLDKMIEDQIGPDGPKLGVGTLFYHNTLGRPVFKTNEGWRIVAIYPAGKFFLDHPNFLKPSQEETPSLTKQ
jgi:hypothetical protein